MNPGRELDALVAEKVMGLKPELIEYMHPFLGKFTIDQTQMNPFMWAPCFSTDIASAWDVVDKLRPLGLWIISHDDWYGAAFAENDTLGVEYNLEEGQSVPHAICLAALKTYGILPDNS